MESFREGENRELPSDLESYLLLKLVEFVHPLH